MTEQMMSAARDLQFELAARIRDEIADLRESVASLRDDLCFPQLRDHALDISEHISLVGKLDRADPRRRRFDKGREAETELQKQIAEQFFLRALSRFDHELQRASQSLARRHAATHAHFFSRRIQLDDERFCFLAINQTDRLQCQLGLMAQCGLQIKVRQI
jgi:hypothetical protein